MSEGKKLLFVTGTRADYGKLEPLARAAQQAGFVITFFITVLLSFSVALPLHPHT